MTMSLKDGFAMLKKPDRLNPEPKLRMYFWYGQDQAFILDKTKVSASDIKTELANKPPRPPTCHGRLALYDHKGAKQLRVTVNGAAPGRLLKDLKLVAANNSLRGIDVLIDEGAEEEGEDGALALPKEGVDPRMARILAAEEQKFQQRQVQGRPGPAQTTEKVATPLDPRMARKIEAEEKKFNERTAVPVQAQPQPQKPPARPTQVAPQTPPTAAVSARKSRVAASLKTISSLEQNFAVAEQSSFPSGSTKTLMKATDRLVGGNGPLFKPVLRGLALVEHSPEEKNLALLETAAQAYLADVERRVSEAKANGKEFKPDKITAAKKTGCEDALEKVRKLRAMRALKAEAAQLPTDGTTPDQEASVNRVKARMIIESGGSKKLGDDESGASESFFLTDPTSGEKGFIFKPADGEFDAGYGWKKGGGAPREVVLGAVNDALKNTLGLDCGVSTTTLVKADNPALATERNGNKPERVGAIQNFVKSEGGLHKKLETDPTLLSKVPAEDIEKVALLDFATLQMDRQASNLLVQPDANGAPRLIPIDAGNALPSRKAFEASRRMFANNAVLGGDEGKKPFSAAMLKQIQAMDENAIVAAMKKANADMAAIDPDAATAVEDESIEITRRSMLFLKVAAPQLTKAQIADAYSYEFHKVIDAKPKDVDAAIAEAVRATLAKPGHVAALDQIPNAGKIFWERLGWPKDEWGSMVAENPKRVLDIVQKSVECQGTLDEIATMIAEFGLDKFDPDPATYTDLYKRRVEVQNTHDKLKKAALLADPNLERNLKAVGAEAVVVNKKSGQRQPMSDAAKADLAKQVNAYLAGGGDDSVRRLGKNPTTMSFEEKHFEQLGGDAKIDELKRKGLNPDDRNVSVKIGELQDYQEYMRLGGDAECVRLGVPQNKEVTLFNRNQLMKAKLKLKP